ncbi:hypothetical protein [Streptomyces sp. GbtcB6]|uniref:hypothetical protein n=1 Tax=Streptomyces sp. GbtcB6 TaxID=2824751 RepID=UPI001C30CC02|nr:hypothetical protein [Streptomyces sp. GbtcB6]
MGKHTTDEVYDRLAEVKQQLENNSRSEVTTGHFDSKIADLKAAIEKGGKTAEEKNPSGLDLIKEMPLVKEALALFKQVMDVFHGKDLVAQIVLGAGVVTGAVALLGKVRTLITGLFDKVKGVLAAIKNLTLDITGRFPNGRRYIGRDDDGRLGLRPERTSGEMRQAQREGSRQFRQRRRQPGGGASGLPPAGDAHALAQAMSRVNSGIEAFDRLKAKLPSAARMKRTAGATNRLSDALEKVTERLHPADLDGLTEATDRLNQKMSAFNHENLPKPTVLRDISKAAKELHDNADNVKVMFQNLATASTRAADSIGA